MGRIEVRTCRVKYRKCGLSVFLVFRKSSIPAKRVQNARIECALCGLDLVFKEAAARVHAPNLLNRNKNEYEKMPQTC